MIRYHSFRIFLVCLSVSIAGLCILQAPLAFGADSQPVQQQKSAGPVPSGVNSITQAVVKTGILTCASRVNQVSNFITSDAKDTGFYLFLPSSQPDRSMFSVSMEIQSKDSLTAYASESFAPNLSNGCDAIYDEVVFLPMSCKEAMQKYFPDMKPERNLLKNIVVLAGSPTVRVFLMPAGSGCVVIKKEVVR